MTAWESYSRHESVPRGYESYSALLIPDNRFFANANKENGNQLLFRFAELGNTIGNKHLAFWFHHTCIPKPESKQMENLSTDMAVFSDTPDMVTLAGYDVERAKQCCAALDLKFDGGPYIAFFDCLPNIPIYCREWPAETEESQNQRISLISIPSVVLRLGVLDICSAITIVGHLESELLRTNMRLTELANVSRQMMLSQWIERAKTLGRFVAAKVNIVDLAASFLHIKGGKQP